MEMADIESLSSDSDDEEYIPQGGEGSSGGSDVSEGEPEENPVGLGKRRSERQAKNAAARQQRTTRSKRQRRELCSDSRTDSGNDVKSGQTGQSGPTAETGQAGQVGDEVSKEVKDKSRIDDLWASFKRDTKFKIAPTPAVTMTTAATNVTPSSQGSETASKTVKVKQKYDFAGEEIVIEKEVEADSKEAKAFLHSQQQQPTEKAQPPPSTSQPSRTSHPGSEDVTKRILAGSKRHSGLSSVLQTIGKKPKMSTLEKSHLDWQKYKKEEGLEEELTQHNKDGYLAKQEFLQKADLKQFELEREERLKRFRKMY